MTIDGPFDALVIGAGPAGSVTALCLARAGWRVALVEKARFPRRKLCGEFLSGSNGPLLRRLGLADAVAAIAGPPIRRSALVVGRRSILFDLPGAEPGRAVPREALDPILRDAAVRAGAELFQPWSAEPDPAGGAMRHVCLRHGGQIRGLTTRILVEAGGAWGVAAQATARPDDWFGFKARLRGGGLPPDLMPLLAFPGGYGGLVTGPDGALGYGCAIRRSVLDRLAGGARAEAALQHARAACPAASRWLEGAVAEAGWLGAGPIRPGRRRLAEGSRLRVGNAAGEAHSLTGEGMTMAMQGGYLLAEALIRHPADAAAAGRAYCAAWQAAFLPRIGAAWLFGLAAAGGAAPTLAALAARWPAGLTLAARASGKAWAVVGEDRQDQSAPSRQVSSRSASARASTNR